MTTLAFAPPRILHVPPCVSSLGDEALDLCRTAGLELDPWEEFVLRESLGQREDGRWSATEVGGCVARQNGKGAIIVGRQLVGLYLVKERLQTYSAHQFDTSLEALDKLLPLIEETPELYQELKRVSRSHGQEGIELFGGRRIRFRTRTKGGGRGFSGDCLYLDEAMIIPEAGFGSLLPTLSARPNPQVWYLGSAVDQEVHEHGVVFARVRERGIAGQDPRLAYFEWSAAGPDEDGDEPDPSQVPEEVLDDPDAWARANPGIGVRVSEEFIGLERRSMAPRTFAVERLSIGDWPETDPAAAAVIPVARWMSLVDPDSSIEGHVEFAFDVAANRSAASICAAGRRPDGLMHVELVDRRRGTGWLSERLVELSKDHSPSAVRCAASSPAASVKIEGVKVTLTASVDVAKACGVLFDLTDQKRVRHLGDEEIKASLRGAATRPSSGAWAWSREASRGDLSPLIAATLALWGAQQPAPTRAFVIG